MTEIALREDHDLTDKDERMLAVWELFTQNVPKAQIAKHLGIARGTVYSDIARAAKLDKQQFDVGIVRASNLAKLEQIERQADEKFEQASPNANPTPAYLKVKLDAIKERNKIIGAYPDEEEAQRGLVVNIIERATQNVVNVAAGAQQSELDFLRTASEEEFAEYLQNKVAEEDYIEDANIVEDE